MKKTIIFLIFLTIIISIFLTTKVIALENTQENINSIEFIPRKELKYTENTHGYYYENNLGEKVYRYNIPFYEYGNKIRINYKNGSSNLYTYGYNEIIGNWCFIDENNEALDSEYLRYEDNQYENPWTVGKKNYFMFSYMGIETQIRVEIVENTIKDFEFIPKKELKFIENIKGHYETDINENEYFSYNFDIYDSGNKIILEYKDGTQKEYVCEYKDNEGMVYIDEEENSIDHEYLHAYTEQYNKHWVLGKDNFFTIYCFGIEKIFSVEIVENTVETIEFLPVEEIKYVENTNGYYDTDNEGNRYYYYHTNIIENNNIIIVNYKDGRSDQYTCKYVYDEHGTYRFVNENGDMLEDEYLECIDNQNDNHWTVGSNNYFTVSYMGVETQVNVEILESSIKKIEYLPVRPLRCMENMYGNYTEDENGEEYYEYDLDYFINKSGDVIIITNKDGTKNKYTYRVYEDMEEVGFVGEKGDILDYEYLKKDSNQYENHWEKNNTYYFTVSYYGIETKVPIAIEENTIERIEYVSSNSKNFKIEEGTNGYWLSDECRNAYFEYEFPSNLNDKIIIYHKNGNKDVYTKNSIYTFRNEQGEDLNGYQITSNQSEENNWDVGNHYFTLEYWDFSIDIPIEIVESTIESVELINSIPFEYYENTDGYMEIDKEGFEYYYYDPLIVDGDKLKVKHKNGEIEYLDLNNIQYWIKDEQDKKHWTKEDGGSFTICYANQEIPVRVTIIENPIKSISASKAKSKLVRDKSYYPYSDYGDYDLTIKYNDNSIKTFYSINSYSTIGRHFVWIEGSEEDNGREKEVTIHYAGKETKTTREISENINVKKFYVRQIKKINTDIPMWDINFKGLFEFEITYSDDTTEKVKDNKINIVAGDYLTGDGYISGKYEMPIRYWVEVENNKYVIKFKIDKINYSMELNDESVGTYIDKIELSQKSYIYNGKEQKPSVIVKDNNGKVVNSRYYKLIYDNDSTSIGNHKVKIEFNGNYMGNDQILYYVINSKNINQISVQGIQDKTYTGKTISQNITLKDGDIILKNGIDYILRYKNNKKIGIATITIIGKENYEGAIEKTFKILPKGTSVSKLTKGKKKISIKWKKQKTETTGYEIQYSTDSNFKNKNKIVNIKKNKTTSYTISKLKSKTKYYLRIRTYKKVNGKKYYSYWSKVKSIKIK